MSDRPTYPRRPPYFALAFQRLLARRCEMQTIGTDGYALLSVIVNIEDARRYDGAVVFYNAPLMAALGFRKWERLDSVRRKLVDSGWLHYEAPPAGSRNIPGTYWVTLPSGVSITNGTSLDEANSTPDHIPQTDTVTQKAYPSPGYSEGYGEGYGRGEHSSPYTHTPKPISCREDATPADEGKAKPEYPPEFEEFWNAYPKRDGRRNGKGKSLKLWKQIKADERPALLKAALNFSQSRLALENKARDPERFLVNDWWREWVDAPGQSGVGQPPSMYRDLAPRQPASEREFA